MKKLILVFGLMLAMVSCGGNATTVSVESNDSVDTVQVDTIDTVAVDSTLVDSIN